MTYSVVGKRIGSFTDKETGEKVDFAKLFVEFPDENVEGLSVEVVSIKPDKVENISVGDEIRLDRNQYGKVTDIELV